MSERPDLSAVTCGIESPNPFWLASGPPTRTADQARRAFQAGWGGLVWKTLDLEPSVNVSSRYAGLGMGGRRLLGMSNLELISERPVEEDLADIARTVRDFPDRAVLASIMVSGGRERWQEIARRAEDTGCDGIELNLSCPHGLSERGAGSSIGQNPSLTEEVTSWVREAVKLPLLVKLTPNVTDIRDAGRAARRGGADGISLINTVNSLMGVDLDTLSPQPQVAGRGSHGGYSGPAVKPIALHMVQQVASDGKIDLPVSALGGAESWRDAAEFMLLGASSVQFCTAVMQQGFGLIGRLIQGLEGWMREKEFARLEDFRGATLPRVGDWNQLDLEYRVTAVIDQNRCFRCGACHSACEDGAYQAIRVRPAEPEELRGQPPGASSVVYEVDPELCVGCNLCSMICPVTDCILMEERG